MYPLTHNRQRHHYHHHHLHQSIIGIILLLLITTNIALIEARRNPFQLLSSTSTSSNNNNKYYEREEDEQQTFLGLGREFNLFGNSKTKNAHINHNSNGNEGADSIRATSNVNDGSSNGGGGSSAFGLSGQTQQFPQRSDYYRKRKTTRRNNNNKSSSKRYSSNPNDDQKSILSSIKEWIQNGNLPKIQCRVEPNTTLKMRKTFRPLKTIVRLGADFNVQLGVWQFKSSWEDDVIGGKLTLAGREVQFSKTWLLSVGAVEDLVTRLRLRAAVDLGTMKAYARLGFRTERLSPINVVEGFTMVKRLPLDGNDGNVKLEVKANFAFPEPEIEYSTENHRSFVGMGDIEINIDELNLLLSY